MRVWKYPLLLGAVTLTGLLAALLGTGYWYGVAWVTMTLPLAVILVKLIQQKTAPDKITK